MSGLVPKQRSFEGLLPRLRVRAASIDSSVLGCGFFALHRLYVGITPVRRRVSSICRRPSEGTTRWSAPAAPAASLCSAGDAAGPLHVRHVRHEPEFFTINVPQTNTYHELSARERPGRRVLQVNQGPEMSAAQLTRRLDCMLGFERLPNPYSYPYCTGHPLPGAAISQSVRTDRWIAVETGVRMWRRSPTARISPCGWVGPVCPHLNFFPPPTQVHRYTPCTPPPAQFFTQALAPAASLRSRLSCALALAKACMSSPPAQFPVVYRAPSRSGSPDGPVCLASLRSFFDRSGLLQLSGSLCSMLVPVVTHLGLLALSTLAYQRARPASTANYSQVASFAECCAHEGEHRSPSFLLLLPCRCPAVTQKEGYDFWSQVRRHGDATTTHLNCLTQGHRVPRLGRITHSVASALCPRSRPACVVHCG